MKNPSNETPHKDPDVSPILRLSNNNPSLLHTESPTLKKSLAEVPMSEWDLSNNPSKVETKKEKEDPEQILQNALQKKVRTDEEAWVLYEQIKDFKFFHQVLQQDEEPEAKLKILKNLKYRKIKAGRPVFVEDDPSNGNMYVVYSGELLVLVKKLDIFAEANLTEKQKIEGKGSYLPQNGKSIEEQSPEKEEEEIKSAIKLEASSPGKKKLRSMAFTRSRLMSQKTGMFNFEEKANTLEEMDQDLSKEGEDGNEQERSRSPTLIRSGSKTTKAILQAPTWEDIERKKQDIFPYGYIKDKITKGGYFGEKALESNKSRGATILAHTDCELLVLTTQTYNSLRSQWDKNIKKMMNFLAETIPGLSDINAVAVVKGFIYLFEERTYSFGNHIVSEGEKGDCFYFLYEGDCEIYRTIKIEEAEDLNAYYSKIKNSFFNQPYVIKEKIILSKLKEGNLIGEEILFSNDSCYNYSVRVSSSSCKVICVNKEIFTFRFPKEVVTQIKLAYKKKRAYKHSILTQNFKKRDLVFSLENLDDRFMTVKRKTTLDASVKVTKINKNPSQYISYQIMMNDSLEDQKLENISPLPKTEKAHQGSILLAQKEALIKQKILPYARKNMQALLKDGIVDNKEEKTPQSGKMKGLAHDFTSVSSPEIKLNEVRKIEEIKSHSNLRLRADQGQNSPQFRITDIESYKFDFGGVKSRSQEKSHTRVKLNKLRNNSENHGAKVNTSQVLQKIPGISDKGGSVHIHTLLKGSELQRFLTEKKKNPDFRQSIENLHSMKDERSPMTMDLSPSNFFRTEAGSHSPSPKLEPVYVKDFFVQSLVAEKKANPVSLEELIMKNDKKIEKKLKSKTKLEKILPGRFERKHERVETSLERSPEPDLTSATSLKISAILKHPQKDLDKEHYLPKLNKVRLHVSQIKKSDFIENV